MKRRWTVKKSRVSRITRIELSRSWQRTDREYATLCLRCSACHEWARKKQRKRTSAREIYSDKRRGRPRGQTHCLQAAPSVTWPCFDKELGPLRGENLRLCCFAVSSRQTFAKSFGVSKVCSCVSFFVHNFVRSLSRKFHRLKKQLIILFSSLLQNDYIFFYFSWIFSEYLSIFLVFTKVNIFNAYYSTCFFFQNQVNWVDPIMADTLI